MASALHTPGPWITAEGATTGRKVVTKAKVAKARHNVAHIGGPDRDGNARLIAAAPDMLAVLQELEQDIRCAAGCDDDATPDQIDSDVMSWGGSPMAVGYQRVCAAIAKATGAA